MTVAVSFTEKLPPAVYFNHGAYYYVVSNTGEKQKWIRLGKTRWAAARRYQEIVPQVKGTDYAKKRVYVESGEDSGPIPTRFLRELLRNAKKNSSARGLILEITLPDLQDLASMSRGKCELTGIAFEYGVAEEAKNSNTRRKRLWAPSIDRKDSSLGYTKENIRLVCAAVNFARQEFGDDVLLKIAAGIAKDRPQSRFPTLKI